ncbi:MAG TPA: hypothetical protein VJ896_02505 [Bacteroidales bacterium]|nr:hypothetical protein [Bacteroidales bacterium]
MKPVKGLFPLATWLMRFAVVFFVLITYWEPMAAFNLQSTMFYISAVYVIFSVLLFVGGFLPKNSLTVISSLFLILVTGYHAFINLGSKLDHNFAVYVVLGSIFVYFFTAGNKR